MEVITRVTIRRVEGDQLEIKSFIGGGLKSTGTYNRQEVIMQLRDQYCHIRGNVPELEYVGMGAVEIDDVMRGANEREEYWFARFTEQLTCLDADYESVRPNKFNWVVAPTPQ